MTNAQLKALENLDWYPEVWWHEIPPGTRAVLHRNGWLREVGRTRCSTPGHRHPGYVTLSKAGLTALRAERAVRGSRRS